MMFRKFLHYLIAVALAFILLFLLAASLAGWVALGYFLAGKVGA